MLTTTRGSQAPVRNNKAHADLRSVLFFGLFFRLAFGALVTAVFGLLLPEWRASNRYLTTSCVVLGKRVSIFENAAGAKSGTSYPEIRIAYKVDGGK